MLAVLVLAYPSLWSSDAVGPTLRAEAGSSLLPPVTRTARHDPRRGTLAEGIVTQNDRILALLRAHPEGITPLQALEIVGSFRLAARIWDLKEAGYDIRTEKLVLPGRGGKKVARYVLVEKAEQLVAGL